MYIHIYIYTYMHVYGRGNIHTRICHVPMCRGSMAVGAGPGTGGAAAEGLAHGVQKVCFSFTCVCVCVLASTSSALEDPQVSKTRVVRLI